MWCCFSSICHLLFCIVPSFVCFCRRRHKKSFAKGCSSVHSSSSRAAEQQYSTVQAAAAAAAVQHSTVQYSTAQYSTVQYSTVQYSIYSTVGKNQFKTNCLSATWPSQILMALYFNKIKWKNLSAVPAATCLPCLQCLAEQLIFKN